MKVSTTAIFISFIIGIIMPFFLSLFSMMVSFKNGVMIAKILIPFSSLDWLSDNIIILLNGFLYAFLTIVFLFVRKFASDS